MRVVSTGGAPALVAYDPTPNVMSQRFAVGAPANFYVVQRYDEDPSEQELRMTASPGTPPVVVTSFGTAASVQGIAQNDAEVFLTILTD